MEQIVKLTFKNKNDQNDFVEIKLRMDFDKNFGSGYGSLNDADNYFKWKYNIPAKYCLVEVQEEKKLYLIKYKVFVDEDDYPHYQNCHKSVMFTLKELQDFLNSVVSPQVTCLGN